MPVQFISGDLLADLDKNRCKAVAHGCNCQGSMGAGIAKGFRARYPEMYKEYRDRCKATPRQFNLGDAWLWRGDTRPWVFNLGTQEHYWHSKATYEAIEASLLNMRNQAETLGIESIGLPRIGAGLGGLSWNKVRAVIERVFADWSGQLLVYEEYVPTHKEEAS